MSEGAQVFRLESVWTGTGDGNGELTSESGGKLAYGVPPVFDEERTPTGATLAQPFDRAHGGLAIVDDDCLRNFAQQHVQRRFETLLSAHGFGCRRRVWNELENRASNVFIL